MVDVVNEEALEAARLKKEREDANIARLNSLTDYFKNNYGGSIKTDYSNEGLSRLIPSTHLAYTPLRSHLEAPATIIYRRGEDYIATVFHPKYPKPIHLVIDEQHEVTRVELEADDARMPNAATVTMQNFIADHPVEFIQDNRFAIKEIMQARGYKTR